jgi:hypothetical protein
MEGLRLLDSHLVRHEAANTKDEGKRKRLLAEHEARERVPRDENVVGYNAQSDINGGFIGFFLISDVQDETPHAELISCGLTRRDAEHIAQAVCNDCDVFLTRDRKSIIIPHREWLETRFPELKVRLPSELLAELTAPAVQTTDLAGLAAAGE